MADLAIKGHPSRGKEVIQILEMLGGRNSARWMGDVMDLVYYIEVDNSICCMGIEHSTEFCKITLEEFLEKYPFKVGDFVRVSEYDSKVCICKMRWNSIYNYMEYLVYRGDTPEWYTARALLEYNTNTLIDKEGEKKSLLSQLIEYFRTTPKDELEREWNEHNELDKIGPTVEEYFAFVESIKKQPKYPTTYEECCKVLGYKQLIIPKSMMAYNITLLGAFQKLLVCRDAYYVILGEQMRLRKPWEPTMETVYCISRSDNVIKCSYRGGKSNVLEFPTEEMRDAFFENFKDLIEICKELL